MLWPRRDEVERFGFIPPLVAIDVPQLQQMVGILLQQHRQQSIECQRNVTWRPLSTAILHKPLIEAFRSTGEPRRVSCGSIRDLAAIGRDALASTLLLSPPVVGGGPDLAADIARSCELTVVCDHFAQAELLDTACRAAGSTLRIRLRIDVGLGRLGVRPGPDLDELIRGVIALESLHLDGLLFPALAKSSLESAGLEPTALSAVVARSCSILDRYDVSSRVISFGNLTDLSNCPIERNYRVETRTPFPRSNDSPIAILAGVVGRPTRDQVVIDVGRRFLGDGAIIADERRTDLSLRWLGEDFSVMHLKDERHDIAIGDILPLVPRDWTRLPLLEILIHEGGTWHAFS